MDAAFEGWWNWLLDNYSVCAITTSISAILHFVFYFLACFIPFILQFVRAFDRYKIQPQKSPSYGDQLHVLKVVLLSQLFVQFPLILGNYAFVVVMGINTSYETIPTKWDIAWRIAACMVIEDSWHYFAHRGLHHKSIYKHIHKMHHTYTSPFAFSTEYAHPLETVILGMGFFWGLLLFCNHILFMWVWLITRLGISIDQHSGYDIPLNPLRLIPFYAGSRHHDFHHEKFNSNFASTFVWWDKIFGTDTEFRAHLKKSKDTHTA
eukprot:c33166_g1_i1.p1 GENE.c33166_g1_i1~~c33166_g1_i1.p1  ORF type:complete len:276 (-),score=45.00 c33166_g1_i1:17-808(-)